MQLRLFTPYMFIFGIQSVAKMLNPINLNPRSLKIKLIYKAGPLCRQVANNDKKHDNENILPKL